MSASMSATLAPPAVYADGARKHYKYIGRKVHIQTLLLTGERSVNVHGTVGFPECRELYASTGLTPLPLLVASPRLGHDNQSGPTAATMHAHTGGSRTAIFIRGPLSRTKRESWEAGGGHAGRRTPAAAGERGARERSARRVAETYYVVDTSATDDAEPEVRWTRRRAGRTGQT